MMHILFRRTVKQGRELLMFQMAMTISFVRTVYDTLR